MGRLAVLAFAFLGLLLLRADAQTQKRVALVLGNGNYQETSRLANPVNDAADMAEKLRSVGFEVIEGHDLGKRDLERKIGEFSDALERADTGLFFYAGHGIQVDGRNFIVPVDAKLDVPAKLRLETVQIDDVLDIMEQQTKTSLVFLDACRNNPFARSLGKNASNRAARALGGLAQFDSTRGSFIAFSTAPGTVALDGTGRNSPFTAALLRHMATPGQSINDLMIAVRRDVVTVTRDQQRPWEQGSLIERFEFVPDGAAPAQAPAPPPAPPAQVASAERSVADTSAIEDMLRTRYLAPEPNGIDRFVRQLYAPSASIFGARMDQPAIIKAKADWFAYWSSWTLALEPGSLQVTPRGADRADVEFAMTYDYVPKAAATGRQTGRARVWLQLVTVDGAWRIESETSQALP